MAQTITCDTCHKTVYITDLQNGVDFDKKYLSCGHIQKIDNKALRETSVVSQLTSSEPIICSKCNTTFASDSQAWNKEKGKGKGKAEEIKWDTSSTIGGTTIQRSIE